LGVALPRREAFRRNTLNNGTADRAEEEARIVSLAYLVWPIPLYDRVAPRENASHYYRFHMRQALWFGTLSAAAALVALLWPLLISFVLTSTTATIWVYAVAMLLDVALFTTWLVLALRYGRRAGAGTLFDVPFLARLTGSRSRNP
jgi:hypothetical protein